ncbi:uncharacterized protein CTRU02_213306 [Colletotrichum truncatum]|uniref:Uncharacterized protein n=1 Tax=Colletotrichum truncatum TaxID=5467 RepID=A0ACC3YKE2_COLTU|nr:uncharacterized protein CTRU02_12685 [Colletotrichum truncatum]KAF6784423.1 hypothetical protein CTRU02_12685 [Colletotrichum truncatum]
MTPFRLSLLSLSLHSLFIPSTAALPSQHIPRAIDYTALGCFTDNVNGRRVLGDKNTAANDITLEKCAASCSQYKYFGVEFGRECYCGNSRDSGSTEANAADCWFPCAGDPTGVAKCGAADRINIYVNTNSNAPAPASLDGITSLGCFAEGTQRVLPEKTVAASDMTAAKCATNCAGYKYFGTQWSSECYCGNTAPAITVPTSECNMVCAGNSSELCGGSLRLNVYELPQSSQASPLSVPVIPSVSGFDYKGCYTDNVPYRVLSGKVIKDPAMTLEMCAAACKNSGYSWFGVEFSTECYCGMALDKASTSTAAAECSMACSGNSSQSCGGANRLSLFARPDVADSNKASNGLINGFQYSSCWSDKVDDRSLKAVDYRNDDMTIEKCAARCQGFSYFGLEYSRECYCGDQLGGQAAPERECGMLCVGAPDQWCGGPDRLNVYTRMTASASSSSSGGMSSSTTSTVDLVSTSASSQLSGSGAHSSTSTISTLDLSITSASNRVFNPDVPPSTSFSSTIDVSSTLRSTSPSSQLSNSDAKSSASSTSNLGPSSTSASSKFLSLEIPSSTLTTSTIDLRSITSSIQSSSSDLPSSTSATSTVSFSSSPTSSQLTSSEFPSSTLIVPTTTTSSGLGLTTITECPSAPTYNGTPDFCYVTGNLPQACETLTSRWVGLWQELSASAQYCKSILTSWGMTPVPQATSCFPTSYTPQITRDTAALSATASSILKCLNEPRNSLLCQFDSNCRTSTYTVGQVPSATPSIGVNLLKDGGWESGTTADWNVSKGTATTGDYITLSVNSASARSGKYGLSVSYNNMNSATMDFRRIQKVVPGRTYQLQVYYWHTSTTANFFLNIYFYPNKVQTAALSQNMKNTAVNQWNVATVTFTPTSSWVMIYMMLGSGLQYPAGNPAGTELAYIDDVSFTQIN